MVSLVLHRAIVAAQAIPSLPEFDSTTVRSCSTRIIRPLECPPIFPSQRDRPTRNAYLNDNTGNNESIKHRAPIGVLYLGSSVIDSSAYSGLNIRGNTPNVTLPYAGLRVFDTIWQNNGVAYGAPWTIPSSLVQAYNPATAIPAPR